MEKLFKSIPEASREISEKIIRHRRAIHSYAEIGFDTHKTREYISRQLEDLGLTPISVGRGGIKAYIGDEKCKTVLLRADIDALPMREESGVPFAAKNGNMHACGHDLHAAMLLGAADILSKNTDKIRGRIILCFESAEETLEGAKDMIDAGLLSENIDAAIMLHTIAATDFQCGYTIVSSAGIGAPSSDFFRISVHGKSAHGSTAHLGKNALVAAARILLSIEDLPAREFSISDDVVLTVGMLNSGTASNITPNLAELFGTFRAYDASVRDRIFERVVEISHGMAEIFGCSAEVKITSSCPPLMNNSVVSDKVYNAVSVMLGKDEVALSSSLGKRGGGSEDFAYISQKVPSVMIALSAGSRKDGYNVPIHNSKTRFDESVLTTGTAIYAASALACLDK